MCIVHSKDRMWVIHGYIALFAGGAVGALLVVTAMGIVFVIFIAVYIRCKKEKGRYL